MSNNNTLLIVLGVIIVALIVWFAWLNTDESGIDDVINGEAAEETLDGEGL